MKYVVLVVFGWCLLSVSNAGARTLQSLARLSNALLVVAEDALPQPTVKSCGLSSQQLSLKSQQLQAMIDEKTERLTAKDFKILAERAQNCDQDCTCDIYAYALEKREKSIQLISDKAAKTELSSRKKCYSQLKDACYQIRHYIH